MDSDEFVPFTSSKEKNVDGNTLCSTGTSSESLHSLMTDVRAPWMAFSQSGLESDSSSSSLVRLHNEILTFCEYVSPTKKEMAGREQVVREITEIVKEIWPKAVVRIFGSQMTKILTPSSDLDIAVLEVPEGDMTTTDLLYDLEKAILSKGVASYIEVLSNAKVPIVKFDHKSTGISVDVCINNSSGLSTGKLIKSYVRKYPPLRPLTIVLKLFLSQRRLNETYGGGMGSFVLVTIIISFLQMRFKNLAYRKVQQSWNLGGLLLEFFVLYGNTFNYVHTGISISKGGFYFEKLCRAGWFNPVRPMSLSLENPDDSDVDIGRNSFQMQKIRRAFEHGQQVLTCALIDNRVESFLTFIIRPDDPSLTGRPGPGLTTAGVSQISDSESDNDDKNDKNDNDKNGDGDDGDDVSVEKEEKQKKGEKKRGEKRKGGELSERDQGNDRHSSNSSTHDTSKALKDGKKRKSKSGSSSEAVVYDIRSDNDNDDDNEDDTDVVQVYPTQPSSTSHKLSRKTTSVEDLFYPTKESDPWDADTPGNGAQKDVSKSTKRKNLDEECSVKKKKTANASKNVPKNVPKNIPKNVPSSSDTDSSEDDYEGVVLRR